MLRLVTAGFWISCGDIIYYTCQFIIECIFLILHIFDHTFIFFKDCFDLLASVLNLKYTSTLFPF